MSKLVKDIETAGPAKSLISHSAIRDNRISLSARGMFGYLCCIPNNSHISEQALANKSPEGINFLRARLQELRRYGYLDFYQKNGNKRNTIWILHNNNKK